MKWLLVVLNLVLISCATGVIASETNRLNLYCNSNEKEFEYTTSIGVGKRVYLNQGSFSYVQSAYSVSPSKNFVKRHIVDDGKVTSECAEYLMSNSTGTEEDSLLARVYFSFDSSELTEQSRYILDQILENVGSAGNLEVEGHTDSIGSDAYNFSLGMKRATNVANYLSTKGVSSGQINTTSKGESLPIADNNSKSNRYLNRRVEISQ